MTALSPRVGKYNTVQVRPRATASGWKTAISGRLGFAADPGIDRAKLRLSFWPTAILGIFVFKEFVSLALKPDSLLVAFGGVPYFLLLLVATGFAIRNGIDGTLKSRPFWVFMALGYGLWALDQSIFLYYQLGPHIEVPDNSMADPALFLHVALFMGATATFPHRDGAERKAYEAILNALLTVTFWGFLYFYAVFPYQLYPNAASYAVSFDALYPLENWALILAAGFLSLRARTPWKPIYLHLLGAATVYALSSAVANLVTDTSGYVNGKLYGVGLTAAVCWFAWIPIRARQLAGTKVRATGAESGRGSQASRWAMVAVVLISMPIVWELLRREGVSGIRTFRVLVAFATILCLVSAAFIKEYLAKSELVAHLRATNERLRMAMDSADAMGWDWDAKNDKLSWFGDLKTNFGIDAEMYAEGANGFLERYVHPEDREQVFAAVRDARKNRALYEGQFRVVWPDGTQRWMTAKGEFQYSAKGEPERMLGMAVDITERKQLQAALQEQQQRIVAIVASAMDAIIGLDDQQKIVLFNEAAEKMFYCPRDEAIGSPVDRFIPERFRDRHNAHIRRFGETGSSSRTMGTLGILWGLRADGEEFPIEASISHSNVSGKLFFTVIIRDVTGQRMAEKALRNSEERFRLFMDHNPAVAWMKDEHGQYTYMSDSYLKQLGVRAEDRRGKTDFEIYPRRIAEEFAKNDQAALTLGQPIEVTEESISPDGKPCTWLTYKFPFQDASGQIAVGGIGIDITERKIAREALQALTGRLIHTQEEERARIARELHDDFSQRLALLGIGLAQLWKKLPLDSVTERESVLEMLNGTKEFSTDLHTLSHELHSSRLEHVGLMSALNGLCKDVSEKQKIEVKFTGCELRFKLSQDAALCLFRVAQEALANVVKHSGAKAAEVELETDRSAVTLCIRDSGKGFNPVARKSNAGIGLIGMSERLRLVGGQLVVRSQPNCGTEIVAEVPRTTGEDGTHTKSQVVGG
ncbi:MAG: PAS domain S-box protein [Candidatus Acidiferrum sp.]